LSSNPPGTIIRPTVITAWDVETAVIETLIPRLNYYAAGMGYAIPRSVSRVNSFVKEDEKQLPAVIVICPGLSDTPDKRGDRSYTARWLVGVGVVVSARKEEEARKMSRDYGALIRAILLQQPSLGRFARSTDWIDESYDNLEQSTHRSLQTAEVMFHVEVENVVSGRELPYMPDMLETPTPSGDTVGEVIPAVQTIGGS
jgi:hypothetical protein